MKYELDGKLLIVYAGDLLENLRKVVEDTDRFGKVETMMISLDGTVSYAKETCTIKTLTAVFMAARRIRIPKLWLSRLEIPPMTYLVSSGMMIPQRSRISEIASLSQVRNITFSNSAGEINLLRELNFSETKITRIAFYIRSYA